MKGLCTQQHWIRWQRTDSVFSPLCGTELPWNVARWDQSRPIDEVYFRDEHRLNKRGVECLRTEALRLDSRGIICTETTQQTPHSNSGEVYLHVILRFVKAFLFLLFRLS